MTRSILVGVSGPFTGPRSAYGDLLRDAAGESPIAAQLSFADDMAQVDQAIKVANGFVAAGVDAVVGHFNSDCARAAGRIYLDAGIPFLMPAATAPDLIDATQGYRLCAPDDAQVHALEEWASKMGVTLAEIWEDGSPYAERIAALLQSRGLVDTSAARGSRPIAILGAHHAVAREMQRRKTFAGPVFVPDDCAISEFGEMISGVDVHLLSAVATPCYSTCVEQAFQVLSRAISTKDTLGTALAKDPMFLNNQSRLGRFTLIETQARHLHIGECLT